MIKAALYLAALLLVATTGCKSDIPVQKQAKAASETSKAGTIASELHSGRAVRSEGAPFFEKLSPTNTGVDFPTRLAMNHRLSRLNSSGFVCGGVCIGDFDVDNRPDLFLANGPDKNRLFLQKSDFHFQDVSEQAGVDGGMRGDRVQRRWTLMTTPRARPCATSMATTGPISSSAKTTTGCWHGKTKAKPNPLSPCAWQAHPATRTASAQKSSRITRTTQFRPQR